VKANSQEIVLSGCRRVAENLLLGIDREPIELTALRAGLETGWWMGLAH
jgi:hypothetical protein